MPELSFVEEIAREAGEILLRHLGRLEGFEKKGARDLVTVADQEAEAHLIRRIKERYPDHAILAEESSPDQALTDALWVIDPLDGTTNFVYGIPHFAVSVAFVVNGSPVVGCVLNPALSECFTASAGAGASLNGKPLAVRQEPSLEDALFATGFHYRRDALKDSNVAHFTDVLYRARGIRRLGSAALDLCYVGLGRFDGFWELHLQPWDVAAGALVARESGALVTDFSGGDAWLFGREIVAANPTLNARLREILRAAEPSRLPGPLYTP